MPDLVFTFDPTKPPGEKISSPELRTEIAFLAPSTLNDGAVKTAKIEDLAVTQAKLALEAVNSENIGSGEVKTINLDSEAVTTGKLAPNAVTPEKTGQGVVTASDPGGAPVTMKIVPITATAHAAIVTPDPGVLYAVLED